MKACVEKILIKYFVSNINIYIAQLSRYLLNSS